MAQTLHSGSTCPGNDWIINVNNPARILGLRGHIQQ